MVFNKIKKQLRKNKGFTILYFLYIIGFLLDFVFTWLNRDILLYVEVNPVYIFTKTLFWPIIINIGAIIMIYWLYMGKNTKPGLRFAIIAFLLIILGVRLYAIDNHISILQMPSDERMEWAEQTTPQDIVRTQEKVSLMSYLPFFFILLVYGFWKLDHSTTRKDGT